MDHENQSRHLGRKGQHAKGLDMDQVLRKRNGLIIVAVMSTLLQCGTASAQEMKPFLTLKTAKAMAEAADKKATDLGIKVHIAIVDDGGNLKFYLRQDGAPLVAEKISQMKAFTAVAMEKSTAEVGEISKAETPGIELVPNLIKFGGGIPIRNSRGQILGGIGVSGASKEDDAACAQAGVDAVKAMLK
jgi:glc operon protein GlcG